MIQKTRNLLATAMYTLKVVEDGLDAKYIIINGEQVFKYSNNFSGNPTPASITLTATKFNISKNGKWQYKNTDGEWVDWLSGSSVVTGTTLRVEPSSGILSSSKSMQIRYIVDNIYDEITIVKVSDGANGTSATAYWLISSASAIGKNTSNAFNPASITFTSKSQTGANAVANYSGRFVISETTDGTAFTDKYTSSANESTKTYTPSATNIKSIRVRLYKAGGTSVLLDEQIIPVVTDGINGTSAVTAVLSNDSHSIPCNTSGTPSTYAGAVTTMSVFVGSTDTSSSWTYKATPTNVTGTSSNNNRTFTVTGISADTGYVDITASRSGYSSVTKRFTVVKSKQGATGGPGKDAYTVVLSNESHTFPGSTSAALAGNATCTIIAYKGATKVNATIGTITGMPTGMSVSLSNNGTQNASFTVSVTTSMTTKNGTLTVPITVDGVVFNKTFSYSIALKGNTGATGPQGPQGNTGPQGPQGEAKDYYDASFMDGKKYWSTKYDSYIEPGSNVAITKEPTSKIGGNVLQIQNDTWLYSKNKIAIEQNKIYKFTFRVRQIQDPLNGSDKNKIYAGATTFDANGNRLSPNNGTYFIASSQGITVANGWKEYTAYMSTSAKNALIGTDGKTLCPAVKAFDSGTVAIKPMFIVNYSGGNGIAQVDYLTMEDYTQEWNALNIAKDKLNVDSQEVFDALTDNGRIQGIYMENGQLYVNGQYINAKNLRVVDNNNNLTLGVDANGNVTIRATNLKIGSKPVASQEDVSNSINNMQIGGRNITPNTGFYNGTQGWSAFNGSTNLVLTNGRISEESRAAQVTLANQNGSGLRTPECACVPGMKYVASFWVKTSVACKVGQLMKFKDASNTESNPVNAVYKNVSANTWTYITQAFTAPATAVKMSSTPRIESAVGAASFAVTEFKLEEGTKGTTWSPAPEDIEDSKIDVGGAIDDVNNSNGQIQYPKLNITGMIQFTDFDAQLAKHYNIKKDAQGNVIETLINGGTIATGSVTADQMTMYNLSVVRRKKVNGVWQDVDTSFNVSDEGHIKASGTFSSFNFNELTKDKGWQINENGDSVFNNTLVRGTVELPQAGMTDYGSTGNDNLIKNSNFRNGTTNWTNILSGCGVDKNKRLDEAYSFKITKTGATSATYGGTRQTIISTTIPASSKYTISGYYFVENKSLLDGTFACELKGVTSDGAETALGSYPTWNKSSCVQGQWTYFSYTVTTAKQFKNAYIYPWVQKNGTVWFSKLKVEEGAEATEWTYHLDEKSKSLRFWSGASYENRLDAPFQVLQDGTIIATRGEFGGTFTGKIEIGNIKIHDTNESNGVIEIKNRDDVATIVKIGEDNSYFNSPVYIGAPSPTSGQYSSSFKISPADKKIEAYSGSSIVIGDKGTSRLSLINSSNNAWIRFGTNIRVDGENSNLNILSENSSKLSIKIGNFADNSSHDDASVSIDGNAEVKSFKVSLLKIYENPNGDGVDFFIE